ncbi:MAG: cysteine synthase A [Paludibacteraceae bacterium]|nr:cysteine synthase A [Paludibacteraceae bacterium]MBR6106294.1 cysteine synthase A [Paludibacteraceae bacterium]
MANIANRITDLIGNTPLLELGKLEKLQDVKARIVAKLESYNPGRSVKDRVGFALIEDAERRGLLNKDTTIIEPTSGNTGIGLAIAAAVKGYRLILTMPDSMTVERRLMLRALGAQLSLTPAHEGMSGAINKAEELAKVIGNTFIPQQFKNYANKGIHQVSTAQEIWKDTEGKIDILVAGVGTGGTIAGVGQELKKKKKIQVVAVEPYSSAVLSGEAAGPHQIQGIGAGFIPKILDVSIIDEVIKVKNEQAIEQTRQLAKTEGVLAGVSSGAAVYAAIQLAKRPENEGKLIVAILPDTGERYLSSDIFK